MASPRESDGRSARKVADLAGRDGSGCVWCGRDPWPGTATVDHLCPRSRGGSGELENLLIACDRCNRARRSRSAAAYVRARREEGLEPDELAIKSGLDRLGESPRRAHREYAEQQLRHWEAAVGGLDRGAGAA
jgi:hypothetical protein